MDLRLDIENLGFSYGDHRILKDINLSISEPGLVSIVGPNGVGKSTLARCILGLNRYDEGRILVDGVDIKEYGKRERAQAIGYVPVGSGNAFATNVFDEVLLGRHPHQRMGRTTDLDRKVAKPAPAAPIFRPQGRIKTGSSRIFRKQPLMVPMPA